MPLETWTCSKCGQVHSQVPQSCCFKAPWPWYTTPEAERQRACKLTEDSCVLFDEDFLIRGCLEIHIHGRSDPFIWDVWVSLSREHFDRGRALVRDPKRIEEPTYFGWLCSRIQIYPDTLLLRTQVRTRQVGTRPHIELQPTHHPLAVEPRTGITEARVREITELAQHGWLHPEWDAKGLHGGEVCRQANQMAAGAFGFEWFAKKVVMNSLWRGCPPST